MFLKEAALIKRTVAVDSFETLQNEVSSEESEARLQVEKNILLAELSTVAVDSFETL